MDQKKALSSGDVPPQSLTDRMMELDHALEAASRQADVYAQKVPNFRPVDSIEEILGDSLKSMARIKLNRSVILSQ